MKDMKRFVFALAVLLVLTGCNQTGITIPIMEGSGTESDPYLVTNEQQLRLVGKDPQNGFTLSAHYKQTGDIVLTPPAQGQGNWKRIGESGHAGQANANPYLPAGYFSGTYDGGGFTVSNFKYYETITFSGGTSNFSGHGMFGAVGNGGAVKNLTLTGELDIDYIIAQGAANGQIRNVGGVVGFLDGGTIENVTFIGRIKAGDEDSSTFADYGNNGRRVGSRIGGVVGYIFAGSSPNDTGVGLPGRVLNCRFEGTIIAYLQVGGVVGSAENDTTIPPRGNEIKGCSYNPGPED